MPTGYTDEAIRNKMDFKAFAFLCAKAMGFCLTMRDDPLSAQLPEKFEPCLYYAEKLEQAIKSKSEWVAMGPAQQLDAVLSARNELIASYNRSMLETEASNRYYISLRLETENWDCPVELAEMKSFMLDQLDSSINTTDYYTEAISEQESKSDEMLLRDHEARLDADIRLYRRSADKEISRVAERNRYLRLLRESV